MPPPTNATVASLLRESATLIEHNESSPILYKTLEALNLYIESMDKQKHDNINNNNNNNNNTSNNSTNPPATNPEVDQSTPKPKNPKTKPSFQRPKNPKSNLIANGWIEQQRRSRMRIVWKEILASLVEARQPGEETTLWIQRQVLPIGSTNEKDGKLEALHQIPMKWLEEVTYLDFYGDFRFSVKVYNVADDFIFRTDSEESCRQWVMTLQSAKEASQSTRTMGSNGSGSNNNTPPRQQQSKQTMPPPDIFPDLLDDTNVPSSSSGSTPTSGKTRMSIKELRAIAHGAGYNTRGMERADLEKIAAHHAPVSSKVPPPSVQKTNPNAGGGSGGAGATGQKSPPKTKPKASTPAPASNPNNNPGHNTRDYIFQKQKAEEERRKNEKAKQQQQQQKSDPFGKFESTRFGRRGSAPGGSTSYTPPNASNNASKQQQPSSAFPNRAGASSNPNMQQPSSSQPQKPRQQQQQQQQPQQQQRPGFQRQQSERMFDPTSPMNQKYKNMATGAGGNNTSAPPPPPPTANNNNKPGPSRTTPAAAAPGPAPAPAPAPVNNDAKITAIKRTILMKWALVPPQYNMLRPIDQLLCNIHNIFPPACGAPAHSYFAKWKALQPNDLILNASTMGNAPDQEKLKKAVRKLRFFLHPDRLPRDFTAEQSFCTKMLWDVSSDAWEEYQKHKDDLDWIHK